MRGYPDSLHEGQIAFAEWLSLPKKARFPSTQRDLAVVLGVTEETLSRWKKQPDFQEALRLICISELSAARPAFYAALRREATKGSYSHLKLAFELLGDLVERVDITSAGEKITAGDARTMTVEELSRAWAETRAESPGFKEMGIKADHLEMMVKDMLDQGVAGLGDIEGVTISEDE